MVSVPTSTESWSWLAMPEGLYWSAVASSAIAVNAPPQPIARAAPMLGRPRPPACARPANEPASTSAASAPRSRRIGGSCVDGSVGPGIGTGVGAGVGDGGVGARVGDGHGVGARPGVVERHALVLDGVAGLDALEAVHARGAVARQAILEEAAAGHRHARASGGEEHGQYDREPAHQSISWLKLSPPPTPSAPPASTVGTSRLRCAMGTG